MAMPMRADGEVIVVGSRMMVNQGGEEFTLRVVSPEEADAMTGLISAQSPLGAALLGHQVGDVVSFRAPSGRQTVVVLAIL